MVIAHVPRVVFVEESFGKEEGKFVCLLGGGQLIAILYNYKNIY